MWGNSGWGGVVVVGAGVRQSADGKIADHLADVYLRWWPRYSFPGRQAGSWAVVYKNRWF